VTLPSDLTNKGNVRSYHRLRQPSVATWDERPTTGSDEGNSSKGIACAEQPITRAHENWGNLLGPMKVRSGHLRRAKASGGCQPAGSLNMTSDM
jgi:hypothetical protein